MSYGADDIDFTHCTNLKCCLDGVAKFRRLGFPITFDEADCRKMFSSKATDNDSLLPILAVAVVAAAFLLR